MHKKRTRRVLHDYFDDTIYYQKMSVLWQGEKTPIYRIKSGITPLYNTSSVKQLIGYHRIITGDTRDDKTIWIELISESPNNSTH